MEKNSMFFSVVVPIYNAKDYLLECVDSILSQSFTDFEILLVDDGSTDESKNIVDEYAKKDGRVVAIHKENGGQSSARNLGVYNAKGKYVVFIDSDDIMCKNTYFQDVYNLINQYEENIDIVAFKYNKYVDGRVIENNLSFADIDNNLGLEKILKQLVKKDGFFCSCWSKVVRLGLIKENNIVFDESLSCEDMDWYFSVLEKAKNVKVIDESYIYYRQRANSVTSNFNRKSFDGYIFTLNKWQEKFSKFEGEKRFVYLSSLAKLYCNLLISYSRNSKKAKEFKKQVYSFKGLLKYNLNPRTKTMYKFYRILGIRGTICLLKIANGIRR